jgi:hypothetical protein
MVHHLVGAKQFCPQRWRIADARCQAIAAQSRPQERPGVAYAFAAQFHFSLPSLSRSSSDFSKTRATAIGRQFLI